MRKIIILHVSSLYLLGLTVGYAAAMAGKCVGYCH